MCLAGQTSVGGACGARSGARTMACGAEVEPPDEGRGPAGETCRDEGTASRDGGRKATGDAAIGRAAGAGGGRPSPQRWMSVPQAAAAGSGMSILGVKASGVLHLWVTSGRRPGRAPAIMLHLWVTSGGAGDVGHVGSVGNIVHVRAAAFLLVEDAADLVEAVRAFESMDLEEASEDRLVEEPLAAGGANLFGDEADGGVVVDGLPGNREVLCDLAGAVEFARDAQDGVALGGFLGAADLPQVFGDGLLPEE